MVFNQGGGDEKENLLNLKPSQGRIFVPKKDVLNNKRVTCLKDKLDKCVMCLD